MKPKSDRKHSKKSESSSGNLTRKNKPNQLTPRRIKSYIFVVMQLLFIFLILITGPVVADKVVFQIPEFLGLDIGIMATLEMHTKSQFSIFSEPKEKALLLNSGPYAYIRNPMYLGLLLMTGALVLDRFSSFRLIFYLGLIITILEKIRYEESVLRKRFPNYPEYKKQTKKLIPFLY